MFFISIIQAIIMHTKKQHTRLIFYIKLWFFDISIQFIKHQSCIQVWVKKAKKSIYAQNESSVFLIIKIFNNGTNVVDKCPYEFVIIIVCLNAYIYRPVWLAKTNVYFQFVIYSVVMTRIYKSSHRSITDRILFVSNIYYRYRICVRFCIWNNGMIIIALGMPGTSNQQQHQQQFRSLTCVYRGRKEGSRQGWCMRTTNKYLSPYFENTVLLTDTAFHHTRCLSSSFTSIASQLW